MKRSTSHILTTHTGSSARCLCLTLTHRWAILTIARQVKIDRGSAGQDGSSTSVRRICSTTNQNGQRGSIVASHSQSCSVKSVSSLMCLLRGSRALSRIVVRKKILNCRAYAGFIEQVKQFVRARRAPKIILFWDARVIRTARNC